MFEMLTRAGQRPYPPDLFEASIGGPVPAWVSGGVDGPTPETLVAAQVYPDGMCARLVVDWPEPSAVRIAERAPR